MTKPKLNLNQPETTTAKIQTASERWIFDAKAHVSAHGGQWHIVQKGTGPWIEWMAYFLWRGLPSWASLARNNPCLTLPAPRPGEFDPTFREGIEAAKRRVVADEVRRRPPEWKQPDREEIARRTGVDVRTIVIPMDAVVEGAKRGEFPDRPIPPLPEAIATPHSASLAATGEQAATGVAEDVDFPF